MKMKFSIQGNEVDPNRFVLQVTPDLHDLLWQGLKDHTDIEINLLGAEKESVVDTEGLELIRYTMLLEPEKKNDLVEYIKMLYMRFRELDKTTLN